MRNIFNAIQLTKPKSNVFDLSHDVKLSLNMGELVPIMCEPCIPGDKFNISCESLLRFAPMVSPVMHRMDVTMHYFFVPNRLLWDGWEDYITNTNLAPAHPFVQYGDFSLPNTSQYTRLFDYLGLPDWDGTPNVAEQVSALPFAAYQAVYQEYYRDQNLVTEMDYTLGDGQLLNTDFFKLQLRSYEHDYFTAALPFAQKGDPVTIPISGIVELSSPPGGQTNPQIIRDSTGTAISGDLAAEGGSGNMEIQGSGVDAYLDPNGTLEVNNANSTINDLRRAYRLQEWLEKAARGGSRYVENILMHFGVKSPDARLQRPEYITGTKSPVTISEVLNTTGTDDNPQGNMAGHGVSVTTGRYGNYYCQEHGYIIGVMSVMPKTAYQQGIPKHFLKINDPFEHFWPSFANIGEQEVQKRELFAFQGAIGRDTFGYVPRYAEYKYSPSRVAGDFKTNLNFWHLGRIFDTPPLLNQQFVECAPINNERIFAVTDPDVQKLYAHVYNKIKAVRRMPKFGTPTF
ncbi:MAG: major capsid protein [Microviridae sp.]|nr:MAG: major capsid protein [Microviridae sp.]